MDQTQLQKKIPEYYAKLTPRMQEVFSRKEWLESLRGISSRYNLTEVQIQTLGIETSLVMLGVIHPDEYEQNLMTELAMPRPISLRIIDDINLEVLKSWRDTLAEIFQKNARDMANEIYGNGMTLDDRFNNVPKEVREAIISANYQNTILEIGRKNGLNIEAIGALENTTTKMMLGTIAPAEYNTKLAQALNMPKEITENIANEVNDRILKSIRESLVAKTKIEVKIKPIDTPIPLPPYKNKEIPKVQYETPKPIVEEPKIIKPEMIIPKPPVALPTVAERGVLNIAGIEIESLDPIIPKSIMEQTMHEDRQTLIKSGVHLIEESSIVSNPPHSGDKYREEV